MRPYLAGAIRGCSDSEAMDWRRDALRIWPQALDPMVRDYRGKEADNYREVVDLDKRDIAASDALLVCYRQPSVGTSMEVLLAWQLGKPIVIWHDGTDSISPWLRYHSTAIVHSWAAAVEKLQMIFGQ